MKLIFAFPQRILAFLKEVKIELAKVSWSTRKEIIRNTLIVIVLSLLLAFFLGGFDFILNYLINKFILNL